MLVYLPAVNSAMQVSSCSQRVFRHFPFQTIEHQPFIDSMRENFFHVIPIWLRQRYAMQSSQFFHGWHKVVTSAAKVISASAEVIEQSLIVGKDEFHEHFR